MEADNFRISHTCDWINWTPSFTLIYFTLLYFKLKDLQIKTDFVHLKNGQISFTVVNPLR